jgi:hypothetical protein
VYCLLTYPVLSTVNVQVNARVQQFESFYGGKYQGRRLVWAHSLERCVVRGGGCMIWRVHNASRLSFGAGVNISTSYCVQRGVSVCAD